MSLEKYAILDVLETGGAISKFEFILRGYSADACEEVAVKVVLMYAVRPLGRSRVFLTRLRGTFAESLFNVNSGVFSLNDVTRR
jgi:hypothetical protein